jgi:ankyrin repeat protein
MVGLKTLISKDQYVISSRNQNGMPLLNRAAMTDCVECARILIENGADVKVTDKNHSRTPLHCAAG